MAVSDSWISAAAGLVGALIGGMSTYLANRAQWRRESRRSVYANLISAAYEMESFIESGLERANEPRTGTSANSDPRTQFSLQIDSALLLAKENTQTILDKWRYTFHKLPRELTEDDRKTRLSEWQDHREEFNEYARDELGSVGMVRYRRSTRVCYCTAIITLIPFFVILKDAQSDSASQLVGYAFYLVSTSLLIYAFGMAGYWRRKLAELDKPVSDQKAIQRLQSLIGVALAFSFIATVIASVSGGSTAVFIFGCLAFASLIVGILLLVDG